jgi:hypothetical protein
MEQTAAASTAGVVADRKQEGRIAIGIGAAPDCPYGGNQPAAAVKQCVADLDQPGVGVAKGEAARNRRASPSSS